MSRTGHAVWASEWVRTTHPSGEWIHTMPTSTSARAWLHRLRGASAASQRLEDDKPLCLQTK
jgi:hypothetical protein